MYRSYKFPWRDGNQFQLLVDSKQYFPRMLDAIDCAQGYILFEMYLFESGNLSDRVINALILATQRGVVVNLLLDDFGSRKLHRRDRMRLSNAGVNLCFYNVLHVWKRLKNLARDHRKLLLIDGAVAFVGGTGVTDEFSPRSWLADSHSNTHKAPIWLAKGAPWRETMVEIMGPVVADWQALFQETWFSSIQHELELPPSRPIDGGGTARGRVMITNGLAKQDIKRSLIQHMRNADRRVWFSSAYFIPGWTIRRALRYVAQQGLDVRLLLPGPYTDHPAIRYAGRRYYTRLLRDGIRIFEYQPRFLHSKVVLCDDWVSLGSSNLDRWTLRWNLEANQVIADSDFAHDVVQMFEADFAQCEEFDYQTWSKRPWTQRVRERLWGWVGQLLSTLGHGRSRYFN